MNNIDLHVHSTCSDGTLTPAELVSLAAKQRLTAFALTDHDTVAGLPEAFRAAKNADIEVISGIEFSAAYEGKDIHILGLDFDYQNPSFLAKLTAFRSFRNQRNAEMLQKLADCGIDISHEKMLAAFGDTVWTRAHFARFLLENGYVSEIQEAFSRYLGDRAPCFVPRRKIAPAAAIQLIRQAGGIAILAHPMQYHFPSQKLLPFIRTLAHEGLSGIEAIYSTHSREEEAFLRMAAKSCGLAISGGSDFHGSNKPDICMGTGKGNLQIPYSVLEQLRAQKNI